MSNDENEKVVEAKNQGKNPAEQAVNKLREAAIKAVQTKIDEQAKTTLNAKTVYEKESTKLRELFDELDFEKNRINNFAKDLK